MTIMRTTEVDHHTLADDHRPRSSDRPAPELTTARVTRRNRSEATSVHVPPGLGAADEGEPGDAATSVIITPSPHRAPYSWTDSRDLPIPAAPDRLDVRLHAPLPRVVIVRIDGAIDDPTLPLLAERVDQQLDRATHVILDLDQVRVLSNRGVSLLLDLHLKATARGCRLSIAVGDHEVVRRPLRLIGIDQVLTLSPCADAAIAALACRSHRVAEEAPSTRRTADEVAQISGVAAGAATPLAHHDPARRGDR